MVTNGTFFVWEMIKKDHSWYKAPTQANFIGIPGHAMIERALDLVDIGPPPVAKFRMVSGLFSAHRVLAGRLTC